MEVVLGVVLLIVFLAVCFAVIRGAGDETP
jgi:hypothetical protein